MAIEVATDGKNDKAEVSKLVFYAQSTSVVISGRQNWKEWLGICIQQENMGRDIFWVCRLLLVFTDNKCDPFSRNEP